METKDMQVFLNEQFGQVRVLTKDEDYWFVAKDVADILDYRTANDMTRILDEDEKDTQIVRTLGGNQDMTIISESGLYSAILKSKKPEAKQFKKWVTSDLLPTLRKTGGYISNSELMVNTYFSTLPQEQKTIVQGLFSQIENQQKLIEEQKPLVTFAETALKSSDNILMRELAKVAKDEGLEIGQNRLFSKLREWGLIMKDSTEPYQYGMDRKWFVREEKSVHTPYGVKLTQTTKVTPKGQVYIIERLKKECAE
jgi:prophage antirepressor-like protein